MPTLNLQPIHSDLQEHYLYTLTTLSRTSHFHSLFYCTFPPFTLLNSFQNNFLFSLILIHHPYKLFIHLPFSLILKSPSSQQQSYYIILPHALWALSSYSHSATDLACPFNQCPFYLLLHVLDITFSIPFYSLILKSFSVLTISSVSCF